MESKYTSDGKKVVIVGQLNARQTIVQEVYVTESGHELPSGENFVVTSLHDQPVKKWSTYYEQKCKEAEDAMERTYKEIDQKHDQVRKRLSNLRDGLKSLMEYKEDHIANCVQQISKVLDPENKWVLWRVYSEWNIKEYQGIFENSDYSIKIGINSRDHWVKAYIYSSDDKASFFEVFKTKEEAISFLKAEIDNKAEITSYDFQAAKEYGFDIAPEKVSAYKEKVLAGLQKQLEDCKKRVEEAQERIQSFQ